MNENEMLQAILNEIKGINGRLDRLEDGQKTMNTRLNSLEDGQKAMNSRLNSLEDGQKAMNTRLNSLEDGQKAMNARLNSLEDSQQALGEGQQAIRRDVARVERKIDKQGNDIADALWYLSNNVDHELDKLKQAK